MFQKNKEIADIISLEDNNGSWNPNEPFVLYFLLDGFLSDNLGNKTENVADRFIELLRDGIGIDWSQSQSQSQSQSLALALEIEKNTVCIVILHPLNKLFDVQAIMNFINKLKKNHKYNRIYDCCWMI